MGIFDNIIYRLTGDIVIKFVLFRYDEINTEEEKFIIRYDIIQQFNIRR